MKNRKLTRTCSLFPITVLGLTWALFPPITGWSQTHQRLPDSELLEVGRGGVAPKAHTPAELKIVSYNIRWRGGDELRELIKLLKDDPEVGGASVIGLQEVDRNKKRTNNINTVKLIAEELGKHYVWAAPPGTNADNEEETGVAILSSYPLSDVHRLLLPHEGPGGRRRVAIGATLVVGGVPLRVYSVHSETRISVENKIGQMKAVLQDLERFPRDISAVILGDFNTWEPDAVEKTSELFTTEKFSTPFKSDQETFWRRVLSIPITLKLDWIWLRGLEPVSSGVDEKICLSDHWPLWTVVRVKSHTTSNALVKNSKTTSAGVMLKYHLLSNRNARLELRRRLNEVPELWKTHIGNKTALFHMQNQVNSMVHYRRGNSAGSVLRQSPAVGKVFGESLRRGSSSGG